MQPVVWYMYRHLGLNTCTSGAADPDLVVKILVVEVFGTILGPTS